MAMVIICIVSLLVSGLTLFSGFGLGTLLMPVFAVFFPITVAIAATAIVHLANNIFKVWLIGRKADWGVVVRFAIPGAVAAMLGAWLLTYLQRIPPITTYALGGADHRITIVKIVIGVLIILFSLIDLIPKFDKISFDRKYLPLGGFISGLFGGLSGHQGALRSAFLIRCGLEKEVFVGTGVVAAVIVDISRLAVYGVSFYKSRLDLGAKGIWSLVVAATVSAFVGAFFGKKLLGKMTIRTVQSIVGAMLLLIGVGLSTGLI